jgi:hypothetical protein
MEIFMNTKNQYLLMFSGTGWYNRLSPEEIQEVIDRSKTWYEGLMAAGKAKASQALARSGATISGKNARVISDGPFAESKEAIGGYLLLELDTFEEAVAIAQTSPALQYGSTIDVRPLLNDCPLTTRAQQLAEEQLATA